MFRIIRVGYEIDRITDFFVFFECCFIIDQCDDDFPIFGNISSFDQDEITTFYSFLIHGVSLGSEEEVFVRGGEELGRDGYLGLDVLLGEDRHTASNSSYERDRANLVTIRLVLR